MTTVDASRLAADSEQAVRWRRLTRVTGTTGLLFPLLTLVPIIVASTAGEPDFNGDGPEVLAFLRDTSSTASSFGVFVSVVGLLTMVWFAVGLALLLGRAERAPAWRSAVAAVSAAVFAVINLSGPGEAARHRAEELTEEVGLFAFDMGNLAFANSWVALGSFALCSGWVILGTAFMPRWLGWLAVASGVGLVLSRAVWTDPVWFWPYFGFWVFAIASAIWLLRHPASAAGAEVTR